MNILFLSSLNPRNINNWSGTLYYIFHSLENNHTIDWVGEDILTYVKHYHQINNGYKVPFIPEQYATLFGEILSKKFDGSLQYDVIVARDYYFISHLNTRIPIIYVGDTTFDLFKNYLGVSNTRFAQLADSIEQKAILNADCVVYPSE